MIQRNRGESNMGKKEKEVVFSGNPEPVAEQPEKGKRKRSGKIDSILNSIRKKFKFVPADTIEKELEKIKSSLVILNDKNKKARKPKFTEDDVLNLFSAEQLQAMIEKKKEMENQ